MSNDPGTWREGAGVGEAVVDVRRTLGAPRLFVLRALGVGSSPPLQLLGTFGVGSSRRSSNSAARQLQLLRAVTQLDGLAEGAAPAFAQFRRFFALVLLGGFAGRAALPARVCRVLPVAELDDNAAAATLVLVGFRRFLAVAKLNGVQKRAALALAQLRRLPADVLHVVVAAVAATRCAG